MADIPVESATNAWTKPTSGSWEEQHWSLGTLPAADQFICFTNAGFKALAIGTNTATAHPQSLAVNTLVVSAPAGSSNLLMLNYAGYGRPLNVAETLVIGRNAGLFSLSSALRVGDLTRGSFLINGVVSQGASSDFAARLVWVGHEAPGAYQLSNGWFSADTLLIGGTNYTSNWSTFTQDDGSHAVNQLSLQPRSTFRLKGGTVDALELVVGEGFRRIGGGRIFSMEPQFVQANGAVTVSGDLIIGRGGNGGGTYQLDDGTITADSIRIGANRYAAGLFYQNGGSVEARQLSISEEAYHPLALPESYTYSHYILSNGTIRTSGTIVGAGRSGLFQQEGGSHIVQGELRVATGTDRSYYTLNAGTVSCWSLQSDSARLNQSGGTNTVESSLTLSGASIYSLSGGHLLTRSTSVDSVQQFGWAFAQSGGLHAPRYLNVRANYELSGGELRTPELNLWGTFVHRGGLANVDSMLLAGKWISEVTNHNFGVVNFASAELVLPSGPSRLSFAAGSSAWAWSGIALLIEQWNGNPNGGGQHQVRFASLTARELGLIWFKNPAGFAAGVYPCRMLADGEIVPTQQPTLAYTHYGLQSTLSWGQDSVLQMSTNVSGPYEDVRDAVSPYTIFVDDAPRRFFRLRHQ